MKSNVQKCLAVGFLIGAGFAASASAVNSLAVNGPGLNGTNFKLEVTLTASSNNVYVETTHPTDESHYLARFWVGRGTINFPANNSIRIGALADDAFGQRIILFLKKNPNNTIHLNTWHLLDSGPFVFGCSIFVTGSAGTASKQFELEYTQSNGSNNGSIKLTRLDTNLVCNLTGLDMDNFQVDSGRFGLLSGSGVNATGTYIFDEFESYR
ncbi:MAG: hypothetical protein ABIV06_04710 [Thermoanaerobaculia bacterium]